MNGSTPWWEAPVASLSEEHKAKARDRQSQLTKPPGSLGQLEDLAIQLAGLQHLDRPCVDRVQISVFAGDHGVVAEGISRFPQSVTAAMVRNFAAGGAAINVLARTLDAALEVINLGTVDHLDDVDAVVHCVQGPGTANFVHEAAMTEAQLLGAFDAGRDSVTRAKAAGMQLFVAGEMGIGNTTAAAALACALTGQSPDDLAGPGTGLDETGVRHKAEVLRRALGCHQGHLDEPLEALRRLGGFEIAAMCGAYIAAAQAGLPVLIDGFISSSAALAAVRICPPARAWMMFGHSSAEPGHALLLRALQADAMLDLGMRLGEGSGAATALPLLRLACHLHNEMATFAEAGVAAG
ncbi:nicotinate-nucleotide-dimethylbenzimidazole phosphoribosyltransferase [Ectothiorhodosinus mongolicus]|uniref:Nicotinate-nucleotide--dimethylbenzimidazole phosphoribosyltransferase n=1 Tax=Ectothiorhodosinus mongolicus TaxID=233100 RepID=A0A1R3W568_9GAMM|nr:nicotinate-nucleotide--dimethylbenzimidazole phosphoribosyltransferase [Ectothiorhodosinus mongolicus]ULX57554.1 nicotinate-nucleotide--dimethylbenzimidazole phosphoribosyltransferase [Ectothiorhodosinus mongolicus]SIT72774.1 nicotinate-nucleotide-dimethylbenzimidazole phosphoribosyltransferase [Ectothiorhodosinus mongolicus]